MLCNLSYTQNYLLQIKHLSLNEMIDFQHIISQFKSAKCRQLFLDYDGTLIEIASSPELAKPTQTLRNVLKNLSSMPNTQVCIITGRTQSDIQRLLGELPLKLIAEHGSESELTASCKTEILNILNPFAALCNGSFIEEKKFAIAWHYRNAESGYLKSRELLVLLKETAANHNLKILDGNNIIELIAKTAGKGKAVKKCLEENLPDFILSIGDDVTDEEMFEELNRFEYSITIKVGNGPTAAKRRIANHYEVLSLLEKL